MKTLVVEESSNIILKYVYDEQKFVGNTTWYKGNKTINIDERVSLNKLCNYIFISNINSNDIGMYRCMNPENGFSTDVVVVKNYRKKSKKVVLMNSH